MPHFAIICPDDAGHLLSVGPIGTELVRRGHRVTLIARQRAGEFAQRLGVGFFELKTDAFPWRTSHLHWAAFWLLGANWKIELRDKFRWQSRYLLETLPGVLSQLAVDGAVIDQTLIAGGTAAQRAGVPFVTVCSALIWNEEPDVPPPFTPWPCEDSRQARLRNRLGYAGWHWFLQPAMRQINGYRRRWGLPPLRSIENAYSPLAQISQLCPEFDFPRYQLPGVFHYIGSLASDRRMPQDDKFPWDRLDGRPLIFASLGTDPYQTNVPVLKKILAACDGMDAQVVLALGRWSEQFGAARDVLGHIPDNALVVDFAPQQALLERAALLVTHAGMNSVLEAICRAVPMVALPRGVDQPGMAARIQRAGVGLVGSFQQATADDIRCMIGQVLGDEGFRRRSLEVQQAMLAAGGLRRAAELSEAALTGGRPLLVEKPAAPPPSPALRQAQVGGRPGRIPNIFHFCFGLLPDAQFGFLEYLAIKSAYELNRPERIYLHYHHECSGRWWEKALKLLTLNKINPPTHVFDRPVVHYAHQSDVIRLQMLREHGGIYMDIDTLCMRPFTELLAQQCVMAPESYRGLCNAVILSEPQGVFLTAWLERYRTFRSQGHDQWWSEHSVHIPFRMARQPDLQPHITLLPQGAFFFPRWEEIDCLFVSANEALFRSSYCVHYWENITRQEWLGKIEPEDIWRQDSNFTRFARRVLCRGDVA